MALPPPGAVAGVLAGERLLPVAPALESLFPGGGLRRGSTVSVTGSTSLALAVMAGPSAAGSWCVVVGLPALGLVAAAEMGVALDRLALVPAPGPEWPAVVAALLDGLDVVMVGVGGGRRVRTADSRRLVARARERGAVLLVVGGWDGADVRLSVAGAGHSQSGRSSRSEQSDASTQPGPPGQPGQPGPWSQPGQPTQPTQPGQPGPWTQPGPPGQPGQPGPWSQPRQPGQPTQPTQPGQPGPWTQPGPPGQPGQPGPWSQPRQSSRPEQSGASGQPSQPGTGGQWWGLEAGHGHLRARRVEVVVEGRGASSRPRRRRLWLPAEGGGVEPA